MLLGAPTSAVDAEMVTEPPKESREAPSEAVSLACWDQAVPERVNTYAAPGEVSPGAPRLAGHGPARACPQTALWPPSPTLEGCVAITRNAALRGFTTAAQVGALVNR